MTSISRQEALTFLQKIGVNDGEKLLREDPHQFLADLFRAFQEHVPFQNVSLMGQAAEERHVPSLEEIIEAGMSLEGGVCFTLNIFFCLLLRAFGFKADVLDGSYTSAPFEHTHVVGLLSDLCAPGDNYIVDMGCGFPFLDLIPVKDLPVTRYEAGLEYKYEHVDGIVARLHRAGDEEVEGEQPLMRGEWRQVFHFDLKPVDFDFFRPYMERIYVDEKKSYFLCCLKAIRFPRESRESSSDERVVMVAFNNRSLLTGPMDAATKTKIEGDLLAAKIKELFPNIPPAKVDVATEKIIAMGL